ncbi:hypothetical protein DRQ18_07975 [bacterium]|nr:MAG: hypothetical protein DRQ18_07975 [bacterium]
MVEEYRTERVCIKDARPDTERVFRWFYMENPPADRNFMISGGHCPDKEDMLEFCKSLEKVIDSLFPFSSRVEVEILHHLVRVLPDKNIYYGENLLMLMGLTGISLYMWEWIKIIREEDKDPEFEGIGMCLACPVMIFQPHDAITVIADILVIISATGVSLLKFNPRRVEGVVEVRIKVDNMENVIRGEYVEEAILEKYKRFRKSAWRIKEDYLRKILRNAEKDLFRKLRKKKF